MADVFAPGKRSEVIGDRTLGTPSGCSLSEARISRLLETPEASPFGRVYSSEPLHIP